jgi:hypothetical protein
MTFNKFGIEVEIALVKKGKKLEFADFTNTSFEELDKIIKKLPKYKTDENKLRVGDLKIKEKRWYVEGYERFNLDGSFKQCLIKGIEIRTSPQKTIDNALKELKQSYILLKKYLIQNNFYPVCISFNPFKKEFKPKLNTYERKMRKHSPEDLTANIANLTFGPDFNFSINEKDDKKIIDIGKKLTYYSPFIVPFSFSSPFFNGKLWKGYSYRTYIRTGKRPSALVFLNNPKNMIRSSPSLTQIARIPSEAGRIEFKAFDTCNSLYMYKALFILLKGIILDKSLKKRALVPDEKLHKHSAIYGFKSDFIKKECLKILKVIEVNLNNKEKEYIDYLREIVLNNNLAVLKLINNYKKTRSILKSLRTYENLQL